MIPLYDNSDSVCGIIYNNISYFFLKNLQGDIIAITNGDGDTVARYSYDAWGKCIIEYDSTGYIANINPFRYRGYYLDRETGLYYLNSRYYDANTGRFINADSPEYVSIQGGNLFAYCGNCPTKNADYFGFCYVPTYDESKPYISNKSNKNIWVLDFIKKITSVTYSSEPKYLVDGVLPLIGGITCSYVASYSTNGNAIITLGTDKSITLSAAGFSFKRAIDSVVYSYTLSIMSASIRAFVKMDTKYLEFGLCMLQNTVKDGKKLSVGYQISIKIGWLVIASIAVLFGVLTYVVPALAPITGKIGAICLQFATSAKSSLITFATLFATVAQKIAS